MGPESDFLTMKNVNFLVKWIDKVLGITTSEEIVSGLKTDAIQKVDEATSTMKKAGELQRLVIKKTTTYYLAKSMGVIR